MPPLVLADPAARAALQLASFAWLATEVVIGLRRRLRDRSLARDRGSQPLIIVSMLAGVWIPPAVASVLPAAALGAPPRVVAGLGVGLMLAGITLRWQAVRVLGPYFTTAVATQQGQPVVQRGPYRVVRHPAYTGSLLTLFGYCLAYSNWLAFLGLVPAAVGFGYRIRVEERALREALGEPYRAYMRRTRRLIPFLF